MKIDQDVVMTLIRKHFNEKLQAVVTFKRWKDGIDVDYPIYAIEAFAEAVVQMERERVKKCGDRLGGITIPRMEGDNLAVTLCSHFDNPDQEEDGETGWTPDAIAGCDEVLAAIRSHYEQPKT